jgi:WD40 repeat protein/tRNA A-37 threonylcarbamoyl transferase component Bud32
LIEEIARGGMGVVYRARQVSLNRLVALKMIAAGQFATHASVQRFHAEAEAAARLDHPWIVPIYEVGEYDGQHYFSMKLIEGGTLADFNAECRMRTTEWQKRAADLLAKVARAVHYAHQRGILHRDLKPTNILLDEQGQPYVTDFGLAKLLEDETPLTRSIAVLGTPTYMSPEQASGGAKQVTTAADIYSLGVVFYELLTRLPPFRAETPLEILRLVCEQEAVPPSQLVRQQAHDPALTSPPAAIDQDLETICLKCLNKDPQRRYRSAEALAEDLEHWLRGEPIQARPVATMEKIWRWCRRKPVLAALTGSIALLVLALLLASGIAVRNLQKAQQEGLGKLQASYLDQAHAARRSDDAGHRFRTLDIVAKAAAMNPSPAQKDALRREAIAAMALVDLRAHKTWPLTKRLAGRVRFDSRMQLYALPSDRTNITVRKVEDDSEVALLPGTDLPVQWIYWFSPDSRYLASHQSRTDYWIWDIAERKVVTRVPSRDFAIGPDSRTLAIRAADGQLKLVELPSGQLIRSLPFEERSGHLLFHPKGTQIAATTEPGKLLVLDLQSGSLREYLAPSPLSCFTWTPSGDWLVAGSENGQMFIWNAQTRACKEVPTPHYNQVIGVACGQASGLVASVSWDNTVRLSDLFTGRILAIHPGSDYQLDFSPDDRLLAFAADNRQFSLLDVALPQELRVLRVRPSQTQAWCLEYAAQGRVVLVGEGSGVRAYEVAGGRSVGFLPLGGERSVLVRSGDREMVVSGKDGLNRWPLQIQLASNAPSVRFGEREQILDGYEFLEASLDAAGQLIAVANVAPSEGRIFDLSGSRSAIRIGPQAGMQSVSLSPDGKLAATGTWVSSGVKVWDAATGNLVTTLPTEFAARVAFSPNGRWLAVCSESLWLYEVGSWKRGDPLQSVQREATPNNLAFSHDSRIMAVGSSSQSVHLLQVASGRELAVLDPPHRSGDICAIRFSPDGTQLAVLLRNGDVQLWDLRLIRQRLASMGLDWDEPPYPPAASTR